MSLSVYSGNIFDPFLRDFFVGIMMNNENSHLGSFRDPSGSVFINGGTIQRSIYEPGVKDFEAARELGIYDRLIKAGLLINHNEVEKNGSYPNGTVYSLTHPRLPFVSYPWEWCFSMHKDAALIHMDMMEMLLPQGFWLRDASAFNIQYDGQKLRFIDTLSIGEKIPDSPWVAYGQFCSHFLAPLAYGGLLRHSDFIPLAELYRWIPSRLSVKNLTVIEKIQTWDFNASYNARTCSKYS